MAREILTEMLMIEGLLSAYYLSYDSMVTDHIY